MQPRLSRRTYSRKTLSAILYLGIALIASAVVASETFASVQRITAIQNLDVRIDHTAFHLDGQPLGYPFVIVTASVSNPSRNAALLIADGEYSVFVYNFTLQDSSEVAMVPRRLGVTIPAQGYLNLTYPIQLLSDVLSPLQNYFASRNQTTVITYAEVTLHVLSPYGLITTDSCYMLPQPSLSLCPEPRAAGMGGGGGA